MDLERGVLRRNVPRILSQNAAVRHNSSLADVNAHTVLKCRCTQLSTSCAAAVGGSEGGARCSTRPGTWRRSRAA
eukprot:scaffold24323_cov54-Phaeocystis_antarctica.AAC.1